MDYLQVQRADAMPVTASVGCFAPLPPEASFLVFFLYAVITADHPYSYVYGSLPEKKPYKGIDLLAVLEL